MWSSSKDYPQCSEVAQRHAGLANNAFCSIYPFAIKKLDTNDHCRLFISYHFAKLRRDAFDDKETSSTILEGVSLEKNHLLFTLDHVVDWMKRLLSISDSI